MLSNVLQTRAFLAAWFLAYCFPAIALAAEATSLEVTPAQIKLVGPRGNQQLVVTAMLAGNFAADVTSEAKYQSVDAKIVTVDDRGNMVPRGNGATEIIVRHGQHETRTSVTVEQFEVADPIDFRTDAIAALSRAGCSQGACHGSPQGKNGFRLSLRGYDPDVDIVTLTREMGGRRVNPFEPDTSLVLRKGAGIVPHQGGIRFRPDEPAYQTLRQWIAEGANDSLQPRKLVRLEILPGSRRLHSDHPRQQLVAVAHFEDGTSRDVSSLAVFSANPDSAFDVSPTGEVRFHSTAEATVLVRYLEQVRSVRLTYVKHDPAFIFRGPPPANLVDQHIFAKQRELQLQPAEVADDAVFLRRVYLDTIGILPTLDETQAFLDAKNADKRAKLIDQLLDRPEYASFWAMKWADVMRGSRETISERGVHSFHRYLNDHFTADRPYNELAKNILAGLGNTLHRPEANFYRVAQTPEEAAESTAQLFLGVRMQCARCHNHPFEALTQGDYYGLAAYFARVKSKGKQFMLDDTVIYLARNGEVQHPLTKKPVEPVAFGVKAGMFGPDDDRREHLAAWLVQPENRYFAPSTVNRIWYHLMGTGIVEPVDDFRDSNPPSHPELLKALADEFAKVGYRFKPIVRVILNSRVYQLHSQLPGQPSPGAAAPARYFVRSKIRMLSAEQILDAICSATGMDETFEGYPAGTRAMELAEGAVPHHFLTAFSKPIRDVQCECAREDEPSLNQVIHLLNNSSVIEKTRSPNSRLGRWLAENIPTPALVERVYLVTLNRRPTVAEVELVNKHIAAAGDRRAALEDLQHALLNSNEFLLRH